MVELRDLSIFLVSA